MQTHLEAPFAHKAGFRIYKYQLKEGHGAVTRIRSSPRTTVLAIAAQRNSVCLWAETLPNGQPWEWVIKCVATGEEVPTDEIATWSHIGTVLTNSGDLVWHYYMREGVPE